MPPTTVSRRQLLAAAAAAGAAGATGCATTSGRLPGSEDAIALADLDMADLALAGRTASRAAELAAQLEQTGRRHRGLRSVLRPLATRHRQHVRAFTPQGDAAPRSPARRVPGSPAGALRVLAAAEQRAAAAARRAALDAGSGELARALASAAASTAQHVQLLAAIDTPQARP